jgi:hypothetical protein
MANTLEYKTEQWALEVIATRAALASVQALRSEDDTAAAATRIIVHAISEDRQKEGVKAFPVKLSIELRMADKNAALMDTYAAELEAAFTDANLDAISPGTVDPADFFTFLRVADGEGEEKGRSNEGRTHTVNFSLLAR